MRKILFLLFSTLATLLVLSCSADSGMPCVTCPSQPPEYKGGSCNISDYGTVDIGEQTWMAKNWGCYVPGSKCYGNDSDNCKEYGRLYDWVTAKVIKVCPTGWHLPSKDEWKVLIDFVENEKGCTDCAGKLLKATGGWNDNLQEQSGNGTDEHNFTALPGGGDYFLKGNYGIWWSADEDTLITDNAYSLNMSSFYDKSLDESNNKSSSLSVRCLKDSQD
ncbi:MAG: hypothetical protein LBC64_10485 [Fibromonadaceae bacterium]|jgi:uncharacterized protein (TIGR02145 family)|nr:hypothetical protein [Fibromonadaceae bacterium]